MAEIVFPAIDFIEIPKSLTHCGDRAHLPNILVYIIYII
jgi:hypothetical protein